MEPVDFLKIVASQSSHFADAIGSGAAWELPAQVDINTALRNSGVSIAREIRYPGSSKSVDFAFVQGSTLHLVELKVESATTKGHFSGTTIENALSGDREKLEDFDEGDFMTGSGWTGCKKWCLFIAYSPSSKLKIDNMADFDHHSSAGSMKFGLSVID